MIEGIDYKLVEGSAESFAEAMLPSVLQTIEEVLQQWLDEHTTLRDPLKTQYGDVLKRRTLQKLAELLTTKAATNDH